MAPAKENPGMAKIAREILGFVAKPLAYYLEVFIVVMVVVTISLFMLLMESL